MSVEERKSHRRRTPALWKQIIAAQAASGQGQEAYCRRHRIAYSSFCRWKRALAGTHVPAPVLPPVDFIELAPPRMAARWEVELELGEGVYLRLRRG